MESVLAIEASSRIYEVAAGDTGQLAARSASRRGGPGFAGIGALAKEVLAAAGVAVGHIATIGVDIGPGGLSSVRAAVAYANGLAFSLGVPVFPITSLELMAIAAREDHRGPFLCLKRAPGGNVYAGLFADGEAAELRHGPAGSVVPPLTRDLETVYVAGLAADEVAHLLPDVSLVGTGISEADVAVLYRVARAAMTGPGQERLVPAATAINEASAIFHRSAAGHRPQGA
jgi:tRNA threonylcarbamoyladenosine biosynthesis protein TsaB